MNRDTFKKLLNKNKGKILEIGPFTNAFLIGNNVKYFDILPMDKLLEKANALNYSTNNIPPKIHFVSEDLDYSIIDEQFETVFSSHCIEHQPDLIYHLNQVSRILKDDSKYFLIIPDKRYCFDHFIYSSTIADIIESHIEKRKNHAIKDIILFNLISGNIHNDSILHWNNEHGGKDLIRDEQFFNALKTVKKSQKSYTDTHAWRFTPNSFLINILLLYKYKYIDLYPTKIYETEYNNLEFFAVLEKKKDFTDTDALKNIKIEDLTEIGFIDKQLKNIDIESNQLLKNEALKKFDINKFIKYKILSKITIGNYRKYYKEKYQEQKNLYRSIKGE